MSPNNSNENSHNDPARSAKDVSSRLTERTKSPQPKFPDPKSAAKRTTDDIVNAKPSDGVTDAMWNQSFEKQMIDRGRLPDSREGRTPASIIAEAEKEWGRPVGGKLFAEGAPSGEKKSEGNGDSKDSKDGKSE
ncbi:hypothetical protein DOTSEDRAFT_27130 [Dothistroma septosporum NZE10]|uniref:Uncharacterized protein n=1 Tax=Dothistroma septosporum (strain NZE10 / CBS 128990) TaxID=675120 RepID=N1PD17_DOTSN|nr:hypothetical protein DOTSEDRAFT_27130 [Dothistroma septosporum NZE10]